jgi:hypothetical protein
MDEAGVLTVGFGHTGTDVNPTTTWSKERAERALDQDLAIFTKGVEDLVMGAPALGDTRYSVLVIFAYNEGLRAFRGSTLLRAVLAGHYEAVPSELRKWVYILALLLAAACKHSTSSSSTSHTEATSTTETRTEKSGTVTTTTTVSEAPGETTTTVSEYAPPEKETAAPEEAAADRGTHEGSASPSRTVRIIPRHGPLVKRTVTVTKHGGETTQSRTEATQTAQGATETKAAGTTDTQAQAQTASAPSAGCVGASWIWGLGILAFAVAAILGILKFRKP